MLEALREYLLNEWRTVSQAPASFLLGNALVAVLTHAMSKWYFTGRISTLEDRLKLRDDRIAEYKEKTQSTNPDEAKARLERLEEQIAALTPRTLGGEQRQILLAALGQVPPSSIQVLADAQARDGRRYANQFIELFTSAGWRALNGAVMGPGNPPREGMRLTFPASVEFDRYAQNLSAAFERAAIPVEVARRNVPAMPRPMEVQIELLITEPV